MAATGLAASRAKAHQSKIRWGIPHVFLGILVTLPPTLPKGLWEGSWTINQFPLGGTGSLSGAMLVGERVRKAELRGEALSLRCSMPTGCHHFWSYQPLRVSAGCPRRIHGSRWQQIPMLVCNYIRLIRNPLYLPLISHYLSLPTRAKLCHLLSSQCSCQTLDQSK